MRQGKRREANKQDLITRNVETLPESGKPDDDQSSRKYGGQGKQDHYRQEQSLMPWRRDCKDFTQMPGCMYATEIDPKIEQW